MAPRWPRHCPATRFRSVRHRIAVLVVISLNGGWTADAKHEKPGRDLGYTLFDKMVEALGCQGEYVERP